MELGFFTQHFAPDREGGTEQVVRAQARELAGLGHRVRVITGTDRPYQGVDVIEERVDGMPVHILPRTPAEEFAIDIQRPRLRGLIRELAEGCELVHVHHWSTLSEWLVRDLARLAPAVVTLHDLFTTCPRFFRIPVSPVERCPERGNLDPCTDCAAVDLPTIPWTSIREGFRLRNIALQEELDAASSIVVPSQAHVDRLRQFVDLDPEKLEIIPHGLCQPFDAQGTALDWTGEGRLRVLYMGHRTTVKGTLDLVRALAALPAADQARVELLLLGDEVEDGFDQRLRAAAGGVALHFLGPYELASLPARLAEAGGAHLAALPSRAYESYGLVADEALALGLAAWVSDRGALGERLGATGRILPAEDPASWTAAVGEILAEPARLERAPPARTPGWRTARDTARTLNALYQRARESAG